MVALFILLASCLFGLTLTAVAFAIPFAPSPEQDRLQAQSPETVSQGHFFLDGPTRTEGDLGLPEASLLHRLEEHVRREHRAAEEFLRGPTAETLHASNEISIWN